MHVIQRNPLVITIREAFPFDEILELLISPEEAMIQNMFYLLFFFPVN